MAHWTKLPWGSSPATVDRADRLGISAYWSMSPTQMLSELRTSDRGLDQDEAESRLKTRGPNALKSASRSVGFGLWLNQFKNPLVLILVFAAIISAFAGEWPDAVIVLVIVFGSTTLGFVQEYRAGDAVAKLRSRLTIKTNVIRDGRAVPLPATQIVPGDVVLLSAGSLIPADGIILEANDLFVNQAVLTGEVFPVEKKPGAVEADAGLANRINCVFMGTSVRSGTGRVLIVQTAGETVFGRISERLKLRPPVTEFERGVQGFGYLLTRVMLSITGVVLATNILRAKPAADSLLFSLALAVGLTPELLPAIISITLAHGAQKMAKRGVIVRRLSAIENFGSMDILCTDKTGTLTEGTVRLQDAVDAGRHPSRDVLRLAFLNAIHQTGLDNPLDEAIAAFGRQNGLAADEDRKVDEIPYDFLRKRLSIVVEDRHGDRTLITKGALQNVIEICATVRSGAESLPLNDVRMTEILDRFREWSEEGFRVLGVAVKPAAGRAGSYSRDDERDMEFVGFLLFFDPPKDDAAQAVRDLQARGVQLKLITGDNHLVARHVAAAVSLPQGGVMTGKELNALGDEALWHAAERTSIFAEVDPHQKERIILALKKTGHVVGYMGDGINDAPALHAADVGISVDTAVDVAKDAADLVLLERDLDILREGIDEGRRTFANTLKYILTTTSANFGNMFSMAAASMMLPFLPLLASQILLNNFLSDIPGTTIAGDNVDPEWVARPRRWDNHFISRYMVVFGLVSSLFDFLTFGTLLFLFHASVEEFRTGWFLMSLLTELVIAMVVRTRRVCFRSRPGKALSASTLVVLAVALALPYLPGRSMFSFVPLPAPLLLSLIGLTGLYVLVTELTKKIFYSRMADTPFLSIGDTTAPRGRFD